MKNKEIAVRFSVLSKLMDIHAENPFKSNAYSVAAFTLEKLPTEISTMDSNEVAQIRGIGEAITGNIKELMETGSLRVLEDLVIKTPRGVIDMLQIKGFGPKRISIVWKDLGIETIGELEYACTENRLCKLKGFGEKTQQKIADAIKFYQKSQWYHLYASVEDFANTTVDLLKKAHPQSTFSLTGDIRRQSNTVHSIDILTDISRKDVREFFHQQKGSCVIEKNDVLIVQKEGQPDIKCHFCAEGHFYASLFTTTGSEDFIKAFTSKYSIAEDAGSEEDIFRAAGLSFIPPAMREDAGVIKLAKKGKLPELIEEKDIKAIIHCHTTYSDGAHTLASMATEAKNAGYEYIVISDHSQAAHYAKGLSPGRIREQHKEIDELNLKLAPFKIFKSIEADILGDGSLDYDEEILSTFDLVIASVHSNLQMTEQKAMRRLLAAVRNPYTRILGHATGRLQLSREGYPVDHRRLINACAENNVVIEINAHPRRLDIDWKWIPYAVEKGVMLSIDPDAHSVNEFRNVRYGALSAQKGGLTPKDNLSSKSLEEFVQWLAEKKVREVAR